MDQQQGLLAAGQLLSNPMISSSCNRLAIVKDCLYKVFYMERPAPGSVVTDISGLQKTINMISHRPAFFCTSCERWLGDVVSLFAQSIKPVFTIC